MHSIHPITAYLQLQYSQLLEPLRPTDKASARRLSELLACHERFCQQQLANTKTARVLEVAFDAEFTQQYMSQVGRYTNREGRYMNQVGRYVGLGGAVRKAVHEQPSGAAGAGAPEGSRSLPHRVWLLLVMMPDKLTGSNCCTSSS